MVKPLSRFAPVCIKFLTAKHFRPYNPQTQKQLLHAWNSQIIRINGHAFTHKHAYRSSKAQFQFSILNHVDAAVRLTRPEDVLPLLELQKHHVFTQLQEEGLLKVT